MFFSLNLRQLVSFKLILPVILLLMMDRPGFAQLELTASSYSGSVPSGPTADPVKLKFVQNTSGSTFSDFDPELTVTASFGDQQFPNTADVPAVFFGGTSNDVAKTATSEKVIRLLSSISSPSNNLFTSNPSGSAGTGIDVEVNNGFNIFTSVEPLYSADKDRSGRYYYSTLTLTFNRAVSDPVIHVSGLGAFTKVDNQSLGYSTELELLDGQGLSLTKLSGSEALRVETTKILNGKSAINSESDQGAATGSVRVNGSNITALVFKVYLRGDNNGSAWSSAQFFSGDQWLLSVSMNPTITSIAGNVFDDADGLAGNPSNTVNGSKVNGTDIDPEVSGNQSLYVNLVNSSNQVVGTSDVAANGTYAFQNVTSTGYPETYRLVLSKDKNTTSASLPSGWVSTGENIGASDASGSDNDANSILTNVTLQSVSATIQNANFGINKIPVAEAKEKQIVQPNFNQLEPLDGSAAAPALSGKDLEDGTLGAGSKLVITRLPQKAALLYNGEQVQANSAITNYNPSKLRIKFADLDYTSVDFEYAFIDRAEKQGTSATYKLSWTSALPVVLSRFSAEKSEQSALLTWMTTSESNSERFDIERSLNGKEWNRIGSKEAKGESTQSLDYTFTDTKPAAGVNLYRLKMIDLDGTFAYSQIKTVSFEASNETVFYPNPASDVLHVKVDGGYDMNAVSKLNIYDASGNLVLTPELKSDRMDVNALKNGLYIVQLIRKNGLVSTAKISIRK
ncbi:hypothetical protein DYBT9275_01626 [Dyadobacter sp. CECT 9275]|uniref:Secretion system C-terminal sorting domain-containing protein n=1 Tax=Dyadobacter helix TaxID=2822344 RepID=A0A916JAL6_9BACT|nr:T9SS type A sorting domain-containing protein [Dyadobacter sp. CECT 9275]CAG4995392.1 hypothetical protein DYBT9275_01626 [Dyadobacter sp. CECT 9275]